MATFEATFESSADFEADFQVEMSGGGDIIVEPLSVTANGTYTAQSGRAYNPVEVDVEPNLQKKTAMVTPSLTGQTKVYTADSGYDGLSQVDVNITAIPQGAAGTPTASKGSVSNHSVAVTPSVTNTTGYIEGGTKSGTAVRVNASELVSGSETKTANGTYDVTNLASVVVDVDNSYTASDEGKVVSNGALVSQTSDTVTQNDTYDTTLINSLTVNVSGGTSVDDIAQNLEPSGAITLGSGVTSIGNYAFYNKPITSIIAPSITTLGQYSLEGTQITSLDDTNFPSIGVNSSYSIILRMASLKSIKLTGAYIRLDSGLYAFRYNTNLITAEFPNAAKNVGSNQKVIAQYAFGGCTKLERVDAGFVTSISANVFNGATAFNTLILRSTSVVSLANVNAFSNTCFKNGGAGGTIYIPKTLYDALGTGTSSDYRAASNWSTVHGYGTITWAKIEGSAYEI